MSIPGRKSISTAFHDPNEFGNRQANIRFLEESGRLNKTANILEIGSGTGGMVNHLYRNGYNIRGIEISEPMIERSIKLYGYLPLSLVTSEVLPFDNDSFDLVMSFDVFEHIQESDRHLLEVNRVLKEAGHYLLQTPNKWTNVIFETIRWKSLTKWKEDHCSLHNYWEIKKRFENNGFEVVFHDIPVVTEFFKIKIERHLGFFGLFMLKAIKLDRWPRFARTNFFIEGKKS